MTGGGGPARLRRGIVVQLGATALVELAVDSGMDFIVLDLEHGLFDLGRADDLLAVTARTDVEVLVRLPFAGRHDAGRLLDAGADGIVLPATESLEQLAAVRAELSFPPEGRRGAAPSRRAARWGGTPWADHVARTAARRPRLWALLESPGGVALAGEIARSGLVDAVWVGLYDLALGEGWPAPVAGALSAPLAEAARTIGRACAETDVEGIIWQRAAPEPELLSLGYRACYVGTDASVVFSAFTKLVGGAP